MKTDFTIENCIKWSLYSNENYIEHIYFLTIPAEKDSQCVFREAAIKPQNLFLNTKYFTPLHI